MPRLRSRACARWQRCLAAFRIAQHEQVKTFHLLARPGGLAQEFQTRRDARVAGKTAQRDTFAQTGPSVTRDQVGQDALQRQAMQGITGLDGRRRCLHTAILAASPEVPGAAGSNGAATRSAQRDRTRQQGGEIGHRHRPAEQEPLVEVTPELFQAIQLLRGLHALGSDRHV